MWYSILQLPLINPGVVTRGGCREKRGWHGEIESDEEKSSPEGAIDRSI